MAIIASYLFSSHNFLQPYTSSKLPGTGHKAISSFFKPIIEKNFNAPLTNLLTMSSFHSEKTIANFLLAASLRRSKSILDL